MNTVGNLKIFAKYQLDKVVDKSPLVRSLCTFMFRDRLNILWERKYIEKKIYEFNKDNCRTITSKNFKTLIYSSAKLTPLYSEKVLCSYAPFIPNVTGVIVNNFFAENYGIRTPLLVQYSVLNGNSILCSKQRVVQPNGSFMDTDILEEAPSHNTDGAILIVQCFNPRIRENHGHHGGYFRCHAIYQKKSSKPTFSFVHTMPFGPQNFRFFKLRNTEFNLAPRMFAPEIAKQKLDLNTKYESYSRHGKKDLSPRDNLTYFSSPPSQGGFIVSTEKTGEINGIWHDGPEMAGKKLEPHYEKTVGAQATFIPDFEMNAPFLFFSLENLGYTSQKISLELRSSNSDYYKISIDLETLPSVIDTLQLFPKAVGNTSLFIYFEDCPAKAQSPIMVHVIYRDRGSRIGDCNHTAQGRTRKNNGNYPALATAMCIWAPYIKGLETKFYYTLMNINTGLADAGDITIKIRVTTDKQFEKVIYQELTEERTIYLLTCDEIEKLSGFKEHCENTAFIQFECRQGSIQGSFYQVSDDGFLGTDHLTGG